MPAKFENFIASQNESYSHKTKFSKRFAVFAGNTVCPPDEKISLYSAQPAPWKGRVSFRLLEGTPVDGDALILGKTAVW